MKYPKFKELSKELDQYRAKKNKPKMWLIKKALIYLGACFALALFQSILESAKSKTEFNKKYKTVIKENWFGMKTFEYHEREQIL